MRLLRRRGSEKFWCLNIYNICNPNWVYSRKFGLFWVRFVLAKGAFRRGPHIIYIYIYIYILYICQRHDTCSWSFFSFASRSNLHSFVIQVALELAVVEEAVVEGGWVDPVIIRFKGVRGEAPEASMVLWIPLTRNLWSPEWTVRPRITVRRSRREDIFLSLFPLVDTRQTCPLSFPSPIIFKKIFKRFQVLRMNIFTCHRQWNSIIPYLSIGLSLITIFLSSD